MCTEHAPPPTSNTIPKDDTSRNHHRYCITGMYRSNGFTTVEQNSLARGRRLFCQYGGKSECGVWDSALVLVLCECGTKGDDWDGFFVGAVFIYAFGAVGVIIIVIIIIEIELEISMGRNTNLGLAMDPYLRNSIPPTYHWIYCHLFHFTTQGNTVYFRRLSNVECHGRKGY